MTRFDVSIARVLANYFGNQQMTPAVAQATRLKLNFTLHEYQHDTQTASYGLEAIEKLQVDSSRIFKTLIIARQEGGFGAAILPVNQKLALKKVATQLKSKKVTLADPKYVRRHTGYVLGAVSPLGQKKRLPTVVDNLANNFRTIFVSAGRRGLEIELAPTDLASACDAVFANVIVL